MHVSAHDRSPMISVGTIGGGAPARRRRASARCNRPVRGGRSSGGSAPTTGGACRPTKSPCGNTGSATSPVVETSMRVPSGDAIQRVYAVAGDGAPIVIEVENASPAPFVLAFVVRGAGQVAVDGATARIDRQFALTTPRAPVALGQDGRLAGADARDDGPAPRPARSRGRATAASRLEVAMLHPVAHRTTLRAVVTMGKHPPQVDPRSVADADDVARGLGAAPRSGAAGRAPVAMPSWPGYARRGPRCCSRARAARPARRCSRRWRTGDSTRRTRVVWRRLSVRERQAVRSARGTRVRGRRPRRLADDAVRSSLLCAGSS